MSIKQNLDKWIAELESDGMCDISDNQVIALIRGYSALEAKCAALEAKCAEKRIAELEAREVILPAPACTYADHSYPAYSERQVVALLGSLGIITKVGE